MDDLMIHPDRVGPNYREVTGVYVRAKTPDGRWVNADVIQLTKEPLLRWMAEREPDTPTQLVLILMGHPR